MSCEGWKDVRLGDICDITSSKRIFAKEYIEAGIPFYRGKEIIEKSKGNSVSTELFISEERFNDIKNRFGAPIKGDILLTSVGTLGVPYLVHNKDAFYFKDGNLTWFRNFKNSESKFIYYWLKSRQAKAQMDSKQIGSTQKALTIETLQKFDLLMPSLSEQKAIAATLSCLDEKIELNNRINKTLEDMAKAIFKSWFVNFEPFQDGEFVDSELGKIPKGWKVGTLSDIATITMGQSPNGISYNEENIGTVFYQGRAEFGWRFPTRRLFTSEPKRMAVDGDVLMSVRAPVGDINVAYEDCCIGRGLSALQSKNAYKSFMLYNMFSLQEQLKVFNGEGTVFGSINKDTLNNLKVLIPNEKIIQKYNGAVSPFDNQINNNFEQNQRLLLLRDTLLPKLMSGEIRVPIN